VRESAWGRAVKEFGKGLLMGLGFWLAQPLALLIQDRLAALVGR